MNIRISVNIYMKFHKINRGKSNMNIILQCYTCRKEQAVEVKKEPSLAVELCGIADSIGWKSLLNLRTGKAYVFCCDDCHDKQFTSSGNLKKRMIRNPKGATI